MKTKEMIKDLAKGLSIVSEILYYNLAGNIPVEDMSKLSNVITDMHYIINRLPTNDLASLLVEDYKNEKTN